MRVPTIPLSVHLRIRMSTVLPRVGYYRDRGPFILVLVKSKMTGNKMQGLTWASLKKNTMLIPLFFCIGVGATGATLYLLRLAFKSPDVTWYSKKNPEPWNDYKDKRYKFLSPYGKRDEKSPAPEY